MSPFAMHVDGSLVDAARRLSAATGWPLAWSVWLSPDGHPPAIRFGCNLAHPPAALREGLLALKVLPLAEAQARYSAVLTAEEVERLIADVAIGDGLTLSALCGTALKPIDRTHNPLEE